MEKMTWKQLSKYIKEARKHPEFIRDLQEFLNTTTGKNNHHS
jgi:hypothetical protein